MVRAWHMQIHTFRCACNLFREQTAVLEVELKYFGIGVTQVNGKPAGLYWTIAVAVVVVVVVVFAAAVVAAALVLQMPLAHLHKKSLDIPDYIIKQVSDLPLVQLITLPKTNNPQQKWDDHSVLCMLTPFYHKSFNGKFLVSIFREMRDLRWKPLLWRVSFRSNDHDDVHCFLREDSRTGALFWGARG